VAEEPVFFAARAGAALAGGVCCDVGQTSLKVVQGARARRIERDLRVVPVRDTVPAGAYPQACRATRGFLRDALSSAHSEDPVVLALPCEFSAAGWPVGSTYAWGDPDSDFISALERDLGRLPGSIDYLNDAELAAVAAKRVLGNTSRPVFVLTVGFGVGAAFVLPRASAVRAAEQAEAQSG
jgi:hypothetical protein